MKSKFSLLGTGLLMSPLLLLSGVSCAASNPAFDGVYSGTATLVSGDASQCKPGGPVTVSVKDSRFHFNWNAQQDAVVRISAAGGYSADLTGPEAEAGRHMQLVPRIDGRADGRSLAGSYGTRWCTYSYEFDRH